MTMVYSAIIGGLGAGVATMYAANKASRAAERGASAAAGATVDATRMQIDEIRRQFDYQQRILAPQIQQQYNAQAAYARLLGIPVGGMDPTPEEQSRRAEVMGQIEDLEGQLQQKLDIIARGGSGGRGTMQRMAVARAQADSLRSQIDSLRSQLDAPPAPRFPGPGASGAAPAGRVFDQDGNLIGGQGPFVDPNLDPTRLADVETLSQTVQDNLLAGTGPEDDPYRNYLAANRIAAASPGEDLMVQRAGDVTLTGLRGDARLMDRIAPELAADPLRQDIMARDLSSRVAPSLEQDVVRRDIAGRSLMSRVAPSLEDDALRRDIAGRSLARGAAGQDVYGDVFQASPGYAFQREEMQRQLERIGSAGGPNIGGRAIMEAQRRAQGLALGDYYRWAAGRERDLGRLGQAEALDAARLDRAGFNYLQRGDTLALQDAARLDQAAYNYQGRGDRFALQDAARLDQAAYDYFRRGDAAWAGDISRLDQFAGVDISRGDQALANYQSRQVQDVLRMDQGYQDYLRRRQGDVARIDAAAANRDRLVAADQARQDQAYYNYLANMQRVAGFGGGPAMQAVNASQVAGGAAVGAYGNQGAALSGIYQNQAANQAYIDVFRAQGLNNALQGGLQNWLTYRASQPTTPPPTPNAAPQLPPPTPSGGPYYGWT